MSTSGLVSIYPSAAAGGTRSMNRSGQSSVRLSGTRMVEYTTGVNIPLYIWMDPYADFES